jgi:sigma-B regulation protein RsbU (phosphoserine phosphatase)
LCRWLGFESTYLIGRDFIDLLHDEAKIEFEVELALQLISTGHFDEVALDLKLVGDERLPVLLSGVERRDANGNALFTRMTVFNAADRFQYELQLVEAQIAKDEANAALRLLNGSLEQSQRGDCFANERGRVTASEPKDGSCGAAQ